MNRRLVSGGETVFRLLACCGLLAAGVSRSVAEGPQLAAADLARDFVPLPLEFPPAGAGVPLAGELVQIDPVNRRGALRPDGLHDTFEEHFPLHWFALLPYGEVWYHGARAELKDVPLGTHLHGRFLLPPAGEEETIPALPERLRRFDRAELRHDHALLLEDDFTFYSRRKRAWRVDRVDLDKEKIELEPVGEPATDGITTPYRFDFDRVTRVWRGRSLVDADTVEPGMVVQVNLGWSQGWSQREWSVIDIWLDDESREAATAAQRLRHLRHQRQRWVPARIDTVEPEDYGGGTLSLTFFNVDPQLLEELHDSQDKGFGVAVSENTLRTWYHRGDKKIGDVLRWEASPEPPTGSSGIRATLRFAELLDGYRPGRIVRVKADPWKFVTMPPEERYLSREGLEQSRRMVLP
ncbi:MAG: hypothetical protein O3A18_01615 [Planctomycetota bacterium]|jgi:hypothetical protein|nr:hypothetical protein [Planctomycetota bacterium]